MSTGVRHANRVPRLPRFNAPGVRRNIESRRLKIKKIERASRLLNKEQFVHVPIGGVVMRARVLRLRRIDQSTRDQHGCPVAWI
jgi:hypothetical protein